MYLFNGNQKFEFFEFEFVHYDKVPITAEQQSV